MNEFLQIVMFAVVILATFWFGLNAGMRAGFKDGIRLFDIFFDQIKGNIEKKDQDVEDELL